VLHSLQNPGGEEGAYFTDEATDDLASGSEGVNKKAAFDTWVRSDPLQERTGNSPQHRGSQLPEEAEPRFRSYCGLDSRSGLVRDDGCRPRLQTCGRFESKNNPPSNGWVVRSHRHAGVFRPLMHWPRQAYIHIRLQPASYEVMW
jgi:hypothetical protein